MRYLRGGSPSWDAAEQSPCGASGVPEGMYRRVESAWCTLTGVIWLHHFGAEPHTMFGNTKAQQQQLIIDVTRAWLQIAWKKVEPCEIQGKRSTYTVSFNKRSCVLYAGPLLLRYLVQKCACPFAIGLGD